MGLKLHDYQERAIEFASKRPGNYQMMDLGLGKTAVALTWSDCIDNATLVVGPKSVIFNVWPEEIRKWTPWRTYTILWGKDRIERMRQKKDIYLLNYEGLSWFFNSLKYSSFKMPAYTLILDEASWVKDPTTKRFKMLKVLQQYFSPWRMNLSASPATKGLHGLWSQYYMLDQGATLGRVHGRFISNLFDVGQPPMNIKTPKPNTKKKIYKAIAPITYRLSAADHLKLPPLIINDIKLNLPNRLRSTYDKLARDFVIKLETGTMSIANAAALSTKLRQFLQGGMYYEVGSDRYEPIHYEKIYMLRDLLLGLNGSPVLVPIQFRFEVKELTKLIGRFHTLVGGQKPEYSSQVISGWNSGKIDKIICHPGTTAYGLNLQGGGNNIIWLGLPWSTDLYSQLNGRLHRQGQTKPVIINRIIFRNTVDEIVAGVLADNTKDQNDLFAAISNYMKRGGG